MDKKVIEAKSAEELLESIKELMGLPAGFLTDELIDVACQVRDEIEKRGIIKIR